MQDLVKQPIPMQTRDIVIDVRSWSTSLSNSYGSELHTHPAAVSHVSNICQVCLCYVYWPQAHIICRTAYTDLAPISDKYDKSFENSPSITIIGSGSDWWRTLQTRENGSGPKVGRWTSFSGKMGNLIKSGNMDYLSTLSGMTHQPICRHTSATRSTQWGNETPKW